MCSTSQTEIACFGMIAFDARSYGKGVDPKSLQIRTPVTLSGDQIWSQDRMIGHSQDRTAQILTELTRQPGMSIQLHCYAPSTGQGRKHSDQDLKLCANLYGPRSLSTEAGDFLERCELYLQDPKSCDKNVPYVNPHHLVDPDEGTRWTQYLSTQAYGVEDYISSSDLLADLTSKDALPEADVPPALQTELFG